MKKTFRQIIWTIIPVVILLLLVVMQFTNEIQRDEALAYVVILLVIGGMHELLRWLQTRTGAYRLAFSVGLAGALILFWMNGAVGLIGSENNPANLMYGAVFLALLIGSCIARLKPRNMAYVLFATAVVQFLVPMVAFFIWPARVSWGDAGVIGVLLINTFFVAIFVESGLLFRRASDISK